MSWFLAVLVVAAIGGVAVVVGALVLATAGAGIAIAAVQQGRLKDVPNPVAIVQPAPVTTSTLPVASTRTEAFSQPPAP